MVPTFLKEEQFPKTYKYLTILVAVAGVLPEYIAPIMVIALFPFFHIYMHKHEKKFVFTRTDKAVLALLILLSVSFIWAQEVYGALFESFTWIVMAFMSVYIAYLADSKEKIENIILCLTGSAAINAVISILQMSFMAVGKVNYFPNPLYRELDDWVYSFLSVDPAYIGIQDRVAGCFNNPLILATFFVIAFPMAAFCCFYASTKKRKIFSVITCVLIFFGVMFTFLRGAAIAVTLSFMILAFTGKRPAKIMSGVAIVTAILLPVVIFNRRGFSNELDISTSKIFTIWFTCFGSIAAKPILGAGAGARNVSDILALNGIDYPHAHNLVVEILTEVGVIGLVLFAVIAIILVYDVLYIFKCGGWWKRFAVALLATMIGLLAMSMFDHTLYTPKELLYFFVIIGCIEASMKVAQKHKENYDVEIK